MTIQPIAPQPVTAAGTTPQAAAVRAPVQTMDANVFMTLLVAQLKNQNPSAPMDTNQMMAQTIQLSMMEKMTELTTNSKEGFSLQMRSAASAADRPLRRLHPRRRHHRHRNRQLGFLRRRSTDRQGRRSLHPPRLHHRPYRAGRFLTSFLPKKGSSHAPLAVLRNLRPPCPPDHAGRHRQQHRQRQHDRLQGVLHAVPGHPLAGDPGRRPRRRASPAAATRRRSASASASPASPPTSPRAPRRAPAAPPT